METGTRTLAKSDPVAVPHALFALSFTSLTSAIRIVVTYSPGQEMPVHQCSFASHGVHFRCLSVLGNQSILREPAANQRALKTYLQLLHGRGVSDCRRRGVPTDILRTGRDSAMDAGSRTRRKQYRVHRHVVRIAHHLSSKSTARSYLNVSAFTVALNKVGNWNLPD